MNERRTYGDAVAHNHRLDGSPALITRSLPRSQLGITRISFGPEHIGMKAKIPAEDTFIAALHLTAVAHHRIVERRTPGYTITLAQQIFGTAAAIAGHNPLEPKANDAQGTPIAVRDSPLGESSSPATPTESEGEAQQKQLKMAAELAEMIEFDQARHPDCPKAGFRVTVYGWPYWQTMLTITPAAGRVRNPQEWRDLSSELAERLRNRYDLACDE
jgi:hypothetical protein